MLVATQNIYYQNKMFKPKEALPCYDAKMVEAWLKSGAAKYTDKGVAKATPNVSVKAETKAEVKEEPKAETKTEEKEEPKAEAKPLSVKVKTRSKK